MSLSLELAAYHEAGHFVRAYYFHPNSIAGRAIVLGELDALAGRWDGAANIDLSYIEAEHHIDVALAGFLAEARFNGSENPLGNDLTKLAPGQPGLAGHLRGYYPMPRTAESQEIIERTPINVISGAGLTFPIPAAISFADLDKIPIGERSIASINSAIGRLSAFFNDDEHWQDVESLSEALQEWPWPTPFDYVQFCVATGLEQ